MTGAEHMTQLRTSVAEAGVQVPAGAVASVFGLSTDRLPDVVDDGEQAGDAAEQQPQADQAVQPTASAAKDAPPAAAPRARANAKRQALLVWAAVRRTFTSADLQAGLQWEGPVAANQLLQAKRLGLLEELGRDGGKVSYGITAEGRQEIKGAPGGAPSRHAGPRKAKKAPRPAAKPKAKPRAQKPQGDFRNFLQATAEGKPVPRVKRSRYLPEEDRVTAESVPGFRCALYDDGGLLLEIDGQPIQLARDCVLRLIAYVDLVRGTGMYGTNRSA